MSSIKRLLIDWLIDFSQIKRLKNASRSTIAQDRLTNLTLINIECEIVQALDFKDLVDSFAIVKTRRQQSVLN